MTEGTTAAGWVRFYVTFWWPARVRWFVRESLPWALAYLLPRKVALLAFVRVYSVLGECGEDFKPVYDLWAGGHGK